jgi:hypothetical protein
MSKEFNDKITPISESEAKPSLCEIKFEALVTMYEMGMGTHRQAKPQWFRSECKMTLESIRHSDEYAIGRQIKTMLDQLDFHIKNYEQGS